MRRHVHEQFACGCFFEHITEDGQTLVLRLTTCSICMSAAWTHLDNIIADQSAQLDLTNEGLHSTLPSAEGDRERGHFNYDNRHKTA